MNPSRDLNPIIAFWLIFGEDILKIINGSFLLLILLYLCLILKLMLEFIKDQLYILQLIMNNLF